MTVEFPVLSPAIWNVDVMAGALANILDQEDEGHN